MERGSQPKVELNPYYCALLDSAEGETRDYLHRRMAEANELISGLQSREKTLRQILGAIVKGQRDFFLKGAALASLTITLGSSLTEFISVVSGSGRTSLSVLISCRAETSFALSCPKACSLWAAAFSSVCAAVCSSFRTGISRSLRPLCVISTRSRFFCCLCRFLTARCRSRFLCLRRCRCCRTGNILCRARSCLFRTCCRACSFCHACLL